MCLSAATRQRCKWTLLYGADCCSGIKFSSDHNGWSTGGEELLMPREQRRPINRGDAFSRAARWSRVRRPFVINGGDQCLACSGTRARLHLINGGETECLHAFNLALGEPWGDCDLRYQRQDSSKSSRRECRADHQALPSRLCPNLCAEKFARLYQRISIMVLSTFRKETSECCGNARPFTRFGGGSTREDQLHRCERSRWHWEHDDAHAVRCLAVDRARKTIRAGAPRPRTRRAHDASTGSYQRITRSSARYCFATRCIAAASTP